MLILTRYPGEKIILNPGKPDEIVIVAMEIGRRGQLRIGIQAPESIDIVREELLPRVQTCGIVESRRVEDEIEERH